MHTQRSQRSDSQSGQALWQVPLPTEPSLSMYFGYIPHSGISVSYGNSIFSFLRSHPAQPDSVANAEENLIHTCCLDGRVNEAKPIMDGWTFGKEVERQIDEGLDAGEALQPNSWLSPLFQGLPSCVWWLVPAGALAGWRYGMMDAGGQFVMTAGT